MFNGQSLTPVSDLKGQKGFTNKALHDDILIYDNPIIGKGIMTTYDHFNNEFLYTFKNKYRYFQPPDGDIVYPAVTLYDDYTLVFSDLTGSFSSFYDFKPYVYINNRNKLYSLKDYTTTTNKIYQHNVGNYSTFYGEVFPSGVTLTVNPNPLSTKVYDNVAWITESIKENLKYKDKVNDTLGDSDDIPYLNNTITRMRCYDEYQNTDWVTLVQTNPITNLRKSEQGWNTQVPRNKVNYDSNPINTTSIFSPSILTKTVFGDRMRDKYMVVDLEYNNALNNRFILHNVKTTFRISDR